MNIELAEKVLEHVKEHPEQHNQANWGYQNSCGTHACLAGWAVLLDERVTTRWTHSHELRVDSSPWHVEYWRATGLTPTVFSIAQRSLGLDRGDAVDLFLECGGEEEAIELLQKYIDEAREEG